VNGRTLAEILLKVWGVTLIVSALASLPMVVTMVGISGEPEGAQAGLVRSSQIVSMINPAVMAFLGIALITSSARLAERLIPDTAPLAIEADGHQLQALAFTVVGVFVLVDGLRDAAVALYALATKPEWMSDGTMPYLWHQQREAMIGGTVRIAAGVVLIVGRHALGRSWRKVRSQD
jgi:hypothetical protein